MDKITHQVRVERWKELMNECLNSGMNKTAWCKANGISEKQFFYWQRILRNEAYEVFYSGKNNLPATRAVELPSGEPVAFTEVKLLSAPAQTSQSSQPDVIIRKGTINIEIANSASAVLLSWIGGILHAE